MILTFLQTLEASHYCICKVEYYLAIRFCSQRICKKMNDEIFTIKYRMIKKKPYKYIQKADQNLIKRIIVGSSLVA